MGSSNGMISHQQNFSLSNPNNNSLSHQNIAGSENIVNPSGLLSKKSTRNNINKNNNTARNNTNSNKSQTIAGEIAINIDAHKKKTNTKNNSISTHKNYTPNTMAVGSNYNSNNIQSDT